MSLSNNPFASSYEEMIYKSRYARWLSEEGRREEWSETVARYVQYLNDNTPALSPEDTKQIYEAIYNMDVMPSMRALMAAGPPLDRCHVPAYNCAYVVVNSLRTFDEAMYVLMCGTGIGFSVEQDYIRHLPRISEEFHDSDTVVVVPDSREGWAKSFRELLALLSEGQVPKWDLSRLRPAGAPLKTFGGRSSGPDPLNDLFVFSVNMFKSAAGRRLSSVEAHDLMCKIGDIVVVGGVRRSALISLSDVTDDRMREAKTGEWWNSTGYRRLANNSAVYNNRIPDMDLFLKEWTSLYRSKSGERGMFSRYACQNIAAANGRRKHESIQFGTNPCSEIILRPFQFCNLSEVVVRAEDTLETLREKVRIATIIGTIQASFTNFRYLRKIWKDNCEEERLLGVSLTGIFDNYPIAMDASNLKELKSEAVRTNEVWAKKLGINQSVATTCVKPSGTVSQLVDSASGMHTRFAQTYIRTIRGDNKDPLTQFLKESGIPCEPDVMAPDTTTVFSFAKKSPAQAYDRSSFSAVDMLNAWSRLQEHWCEHKPSVTISVKESEWMEVGAWVYANFDKLSGVSFLPYDGGTYKQAPYQELTESEWSAWVEKHPPVQLDWKKLSDFEKQDTTVAAQELACSGGVCEITQLSN